jgi:hypothetical protein
MTRFFHFSQNNSGAWFHEDEDAGIGRQVWVEAHNATEANNIAESIGIYFDGVVRGLDCQCCGNRWYRVWPENEGYEQPEPFHPIAYVHFLDGRIGTIREASQINANARLIAAAPAMLAALRGLLEDAKSYGMADSAFSGSLIEAAITIAEAEGRS